MIHVKHLVLSADSVFVCFFSFFGPKCTLPSLHGYTSKSYLIFPKVFKTKCWNTVLYTHLSTFLILLIKKWYTVLHITYFSFHFDILASDCRLILYLYMYISHEYIFVCSWFTENGNTEVKGMNYFYDDDRAFSNLVGVYVSN